MQTIKIINKTHKIDINLSIDHNNKKTLDYLKSILTEKYKVNFSFFIDDRRINRKELKRIYNQLLSKKEQEKQEFIKKELKRKNPFHNSKGESRAWAELPDDKYLVTGLDCSGRRFKRYCETWFDCSCINVFNGSKWLIRKDKKHLIQRIYN